ncbi:MAG: DUF523 domain-containing protein [Clostridia bacterium]|nr:DUF523 domain-containing protein [Clostridia bacterium]
MKILVSACLLGIKCKYNGEDNYIKYIEQFSEQNELIAVCPEELGGLLTPREPCEIKDGRVITSSGKDLTEEFNKGADRVVEIAKERQVDLCILKQYSPSCGAGAIYDGTFSHKAKIGWGITAKKLREAGFKVISEENLIFPHEDEETEGI